MLSLKERVLFKKPFRKNGYIPKSTLHYWYSNGFGKILLIYLQNFIAGLILNFAKNLPFNFVFLDSTKTRKGNNKKEGIKYVLILLYFNKKHKELFSIDYFYPPFDIILFIIPDYDLELIAKYVEKLKNIEIIGIFADGEFCYNSICKQALKIANEVQIKPHKKRRGKYVSLVKRKYSSEVYKARMPGESIFGAITNYLNEEKLSKEKTYPNNYVYGLFMYHVHNIKRAYEILIKYKKRKRKSKIYIISIFSWTSS